MIKNLNFIIILSTGGQGRLDTHLDITLSTVTPNLQDRKTAIGKTDVKIIEFCNIFNDCSSNQSMVSI